MVLLASTDRDLQHPLGQFAIKCKAVGIRVSTSNSEAMILVWKMTDSTPPGWKWVAAPGEEVQVSLGLIHDSGQNGAWDQQADQHGISSNTGVVPDRCNEDGAEPERRAFNLPVPTLPDEQELFLVTERVKLQIQQLKWVVAPLHQKEPVKLARVSGRKSNTCWTKIISFIDKW